MNESNELQALIDRLKQRPNSPHRNKAISHGFDMLAHIKLMDIERFPTRSPSAGAQPIYGMDPAKQGADRTVTTRFDPNDCICRYGSLDQNCPVHGA